MVPFLLAANAAGSLASNVIDAISDKFSHTPKTQAAGDAAPADFAAALQGAQQTQSTKALSATDLQNRQAQMTSAFMASPEITSAIAQADPSKPVELEFSAGGRVSLRGADGALHPLSLSGGTSQLAQQLYAMRNPGAALGLAASPSVLAVDPTHPLTPTWSLLPARH